MAISRVLAARTMVCLCFAGWLFAQETLPQQVHRLQSDFKTQDFPNYKLPADVGTVTKEADVVIRGRIVAGRSRLNDNQTGLVTDYLLQGEELLKPAIPPMQQGTLVVRRVGGLTVMEGHKVSHTVAHTPLFQPGHDYILFLKLDPASKTYQLSHGPFAMYEVKADHIETVEDLGELNRQYNNMDWAEFSKIVRDAATPKRGEETEQKNPN
jgi:hypothetical protein